MREGLPGPVTMRLLLGRLMRGHRENNGMPLRQADLHLQTCGAEPASATHLELGAVHTAGLKHVIHLCDLYGVSSHLERVRLLNICRGANAGTWWGDHHDVLSPGEYLYLGLEQEAADRIHMFCPDALPDLVQMPEYARAVLTRTYRDPVVVERRLALLLKRQERLHTRSLSVHVLVTEAALRHLDDRRITFRQLEHLQDLTDHPQLSIQITSAAVPAQPVSLIRITPVPLPKTSKAAHLLSFPDDLPATGVTVIPLPDVRLLLLPDLVLLGPGDYLDDPATVDSHRELLIDLFDEAFPSAQTPQLLQEFSRWL